MAASGDWGAGLPATRDLTSNDETISVLTMASAMIASGTPINELKDKYFGSNEGTTPGPTVVISAIGSAESKMLMKSLPNFHLVCVYAMFGEKNRIKTKAEHQNGQDFVRMKVQQLKWLFEGEAGKTWEVLAVDDGCPDDSKSLARAIIKADGMENVRVLDLADTVSDETHDRHEFFKSRGLTAGCKQSRKGGAILYGLMEGSKCDKENAIVMYTDSDLSTDMSLCGLLADGILGKPNAAMSMGARYGMAGTFLVKPPDCGAAGHPQSHFEQPNMMKIVMRHWVRVRLLPMLVGIMDTQCAFKCFRASDLMPIINEVKGLGADFDMELLLCALSHYQGAGKKDQAKLCEVYPTLFTEDFAESNFMATADDPDKSYKTYAGMTTGMVKMHERYVPEGGGRDTAKEVVAWANELTWESYKKMVLKLQADNGNTLIDKDFTLEEIKAACA